MTTVLAWAFAVYGVILLVQVVVRATRTRRWTHVSYGITMAAFGCFCIAAADLIYGKHPRDVRILSQAVGTLLFIVGHGMAWYAEKRGVDRRPALR